MKKKPEPFNSIQERIEFEYGTQKLTLLDKTSGLDRINARSQEIFILLIESKKMAYQLIKTNFSLTKEDNLKKIQRTYDCLKGMEILLSDLYRESLLMQKHIDSNEME